MACAAATLEAEPFLLSLGEEAHRDARSDGESLEDEEGGLGRGRSFGSRARRLEGALAAGWYGGGGSGRVSGLLPRELGRDATPLNGVGRGILLADGA